jgi:D-arabinose 1-dehydrogenase-like Zn-dependent alcohol dehydrogenase
VPRRHPCSDTFPTYPEPRDGERKAVAFDGVGDIRREDVSDPKVPEPAGAVARLTASAISSTGLQVIRGRFPGMVPGLILGHEGGGMVEDIENDVRKASCIDEDPVINLSVAPRPGIGVR